MGIDDGVDESQLGLDEHDRAMTEVGSKVSDDLLSEEDKQDPVSAYRNTRGAMWTKEAWSRGNTPGVHTDEQTMAMHREEADQLSRKLEQIDEYIKTNGTPEQQQQLEQLKR